MVLIPISMILIGIAGALFLWAVNNNQFEQLDKHGFDIFEEDSGDDQ
ncbi:MAG: cbb3-type cytochrome oxidase assembly protein CcoS [Pseudomonadales bacterium]